MINNENIEEVNPVKILIAVHKDNEKKAVTDEQYSSLVGYTPDGIIARHEELDFDLIYAMYEINAHYATDGADDIPATDKRRKNTIPNPVFTDYTGEQYTQWQMAHHQETHESGCALCEAVKYGWLPSCGEMSPAKDNIEEFNRLMTLIGGTPLSDADHWTSTGYSEEYMWHMNPVSGQFGFWKSKNTVMKVRPVKSASEYEEIV